MGQQDKKLRILVIDPDQTFVAELRLLVHAGLDISFLSHAGVAAPDDALAGRDVVVIGVDCVAGLALLTRVCGRPGAPPVIAVGGTSHDGKPPEHLLLLAELRGAVAALPKPIEAAELVLVASRVVRPGSAPAVQQAIILQDHAPPCTGA